MINQTTSKVVDLIVPPVKISAFTFRKLSFFILFIGFISIVKADVHHYGCWIPNSNPNLNRIWYILDVAHPGPTNFINDLNGNGTDDMYYALQNRCGNSMATSCTVYQKNGDVRGHGYLAEYSVEYCPLDGYVAVFLVASFFLALGMCSRKV